MNENAKPMIQMQNSLFSNMVNFQKQMLQQNVMKSMIRATPAVTNTQNNFYDCDDQNQKNILFTKQRTHNQIKLNIHFKRKNLIQELFLEKKNN